MRSNIQRTLNLRVSWLKAAQKQYEDLCNILVGGTICNHPMLEPSKELGLDSQRVKKLASKLHVHTVDYAAKLVHTRRAFPALVNSH